MSYESLKLDNQLCFPLYAASRRIVNLYRPVLGPLGLTYTQYITLLALWEDDGQTVKTLGNRLFLDSGTLTPLLKKLEAQGLVSRVRSTQDERNVTIHLTAAGHELKLEAVKVPQQIAQCVNLAENDARDLHRLLHMLLDEGVTTPR